MFAPRINYIAIVTCVVFQFVFSLLWYSPFVFGDLWSSYAKMSAEEFGALGARPDLLFVLGLIAATYTLAWLIISTRSNTGKGGAKYGFIIWLGFLVPAIWSGNTLKGFSYELSILESACYFINFITTGIVLGSWKRRA